MEKTAKIITISVLILLGSCASSQKYQWKHNSKQASEFAYDSTDCSSLADQRYGVQSPHRYNPQTCKNSGLGGGLNCGLAQGNANAQWQRAKQQLFQSCLGKKGWYLTRLN